MDDGKRTILVVEDEPIVRAGIVDNLTYEGYCVIACSDGRSGIESYEKQKPDLVILDLMMPGLDGFEVCKKIRSKQDGIPVIMLTARSEEVDKVVGLEVGADDYLTKPFAMRELAARIKALLRRCDVLNHQERASLESQKPLDELAFGDVSIDFRTYRAKKGADEISLSVKELELLRYLAKKPDHPVSRDELLDEVWGYTSYPTTRTVDNFVARIRQKVEDSPQNPRYLLTVHGVGYKFVF